MIMITTIKKGSSVEKVREQYRKYKEATKKGQDIQKFCGSIQLKKDPLKLQKEWRNEWQ